jgi:hypothetical protein
MARSIHEPEPAPFCGGPGRFVGRGSRSERGAWGWEPVDPGGLRVTASIGLASGGANALDTARGNLRRAKLLGGTRVVSWDGEATHLLRGHQVVPWPDEALMLPRRRSD